MRVAHVLRRHSTAISASEHESPALRKDSCASQPCTDSRPQPATKVISFRRLWTGNSKQHGAETDEATGSPFDSEGPGFINRLWLLPFELQAQIIKSLSSEDILKFRISCTGALTLIDSHASTVGRLVLVELSIGGYEHIESLYPVPQNADRRFYLGILHRQAVVERMVQFLTDWIVEEIYRIHTSSRRLEFHPYQLLLAQAFRVPLTVAYDYLSKVREAVEVSYAAKGFPLESATSVRKSLEKVILIYPLPSLIHASELLRTVISVFRGHTRAPSYAGSIERQIRGWNRPAVPAESTFQLIVFGNLDQMLKVLDEKSLSSRLRQVGHFMNELHGQRTSSAEVQQDKAIVVLPAAYVVQASTKRLPEFIEIFYQCTRKRLLKAGCPVSAPHADIFTELVPKTTSGSSEAARLADENSRSRNLPIMFLR